MYEDAIKLIHKGIVSHPEVKGDFRILQDGRISVKLKNESKRMHFLNVISLLEIIDAADVNDGRLNENDVED